MRHIRRSVVGLLLCVLLLAVHSAGAASSRLTIRFFDVGQGDLAAVIVPGGGTILVDAGDEKADDLPARLAKMAFPAPLRVVITHPHSDHIGGLMPVLKSVHVTTVYGNGSDHASRLYEDVLGYLVANRVQYVLCREGQKYRFGGAEIAVLHPGTGDRSSDVNEMSVVLMLNYGKFRALFTGDAGKWAENKMLERGASLKADVLKVGHHGSHYSTSSAFLAAVRPSVAVISVGAHNDYGHPASETLKKLKKAGVTVYRTDRRGDITISTDGRTWSVKTSR